MKKRLPVERPAPGETEMNTPLRPKVRLFAMAWMAAMMTSCAAAAPVRPASDAVESRGYEQSMPMATAAPAAAPMEAPAGGTTNSSVEPQPAQQRLVIRTAEMSIVVSNTLEQINAISKLAAQYGGFVVQSGTSKVGNDALQGQITLRVDAKNFDAALSDIRRLAVDVQSENIRGEDVTAEFVDLEAQLKNLEAAEAQLNKIMEQAFNTEDVLNVYQQLTQIRGQIEQIKGRMKFLSQSAALSTINVNLIPDALAQPVEVGGWRLEGVAKDAVEALIATLQGLASITVWFVIVILPVLVIFAIPVVLVIWLIRRALRNRKPVKPAA
jgi:hypothetical protein